MSAWHRPDVETAAVEHLTAVVGPVSARQIVDGLLARGQRRVADALELGESGVGGRVSATCPDPGHPTWLRGRGDRRGCPWCRVAALEAQAATAESRGRALGHVAGLREAAEMVDVDDDCGCGGCDACTSRQDAARIRAHADRMADALTGITGGAPARPRVLCVHGYVLGQDSCPGCDAAEEQPHHPDPVQVRTSYGADVELCRVCGQRPMRCPRPGGGA